MEEIREGMKIKIRLCQCLGVMGRDIRHHFADLKKMDIRLSG